MDNTASNLDVEHRLWYFREDIGVNLHHWHWHLVYPARAGKQKAIVDKDRRGELFSYMHEQVLARYNAERLCNNLHRVKKLHNLREPIAEGYFPKLSSLNASRVWAGRPAGLIPKDVDRDVEGFEYFLDLADMERWAERIHEAISQGFVIASTGNDDDKSCTKSESEVKRVPLDCTSGIDILGNLIEASELSLNPKFYGNLHNGGHNILAYLHDHDGRNLEGNGVIGETVRDFSALNKFADNQPRKSFSKLQCAIRSSTAGTLTLTHSSSCTKRLCRHTPKMSSLLRA